MKTIGSIKQVQRSGRSLGLLLLATTIAACGESPVALENTYEAPPYVAPAVAEETISILPSSSLVQAGETLWVEIIVPAGDPASLMTASGVLAWDATRFRYVGVTVTGWEEVHEGFRMDGEVALNMSGSAGLVTGTLRAEFRALEDGNADGFDLREFSTLHRPDDDIIR